MGFWAEETSGPKSEISPSVAIFARVVVFLVGCVILPALVYEYSAANNPAKKHLFTEDDIPSMSLDEIKRRGGQPETQDASWEPCCLSISVPLKKQGGVYVIRVLINNAIYLDAIVDSGAADVSVPADVVMTLMRNRTITTTDFVGARNYTLADGSTMPSETFRIRSLKVGDKIVENVTGSVAPVNGDLLLGQSFLSRLTSWSIDNAKHALILK
jgi:predicted aspartyl protease